MPPLYMSALQVLVEGLLQQLYVRHTSESLDTVYIIIINILMVTQDSSIRALLFQKTLGKLSTASQWYGEKSIVTVILVLLSHYFSANC